MRWRKKFNLLWVIFTQLLVGVFPAYLQAQKKEEPPEAISPYRWQFNTPGPTIKTDIAAFILNGRLPTDLINLPDLDIIITPENKRLIPLLRILNALEADGEIQDNKLTFKFETGPQAILDIALKTLQVQTESFPVELRVGISDVTNAGEIYVSEEVLKKGLGFDFQWSEERYEYRIELKEDIEFFKRKRSNEKHLWLKSTEKIIEALSETEPPAYPKDSKRLISFMETELRTEINRSWADNSKTVHQITQQPGVTLWGNVFNGNYELELNKSVEYPNPEFQKWSSWIDNGLWTSKKENLLVNVGDINIGLSELVVPGAALFGASFKLLPSENRLTEERQKFFGSNRPSFLSVGIFEGHAPLGANVDLYINNRLIGSQAVEESTLAPVGRGYYRFDGVGLLDSSINEIKIIVKRQDGVIEEYYREIAGTSQLLPPKQWALVGGLGTQKQKETGELRAKGEFAGLRLLYGLWEKVTIGLTVATQDKFAVLKDEFNQSFIAPLRHYFSQQVAAQLLDRLIAKTEVGTSYDPEKNKSAIASIIDLEYYLKKTRFKCQFFSFGSQYSNGVTSVSDRQGYNFSVNHNFFKGWLTKAGFLHIGNNLNDKLITTQKEDLLTSILAIPNLLFKSKVELQVARSMRTDAQSKTIKGDMQTIKLRSILTKKLDFDGQYSFGENISTTGELKFGLPVADVGSLSSYGKNASFNYKLTGFHTLSLRYWESSFYKRAEVISQYIHSGRYEWRSRFESGKDLIKSKYYANEYFDVRLDKAGDYLLGMKTGFDQNNNSYNISFYVTLRDLFFLRKGKVKHVSRRGISPNRGGLHGFVYADLNGNGHRDKDEPGIEGVAILLDGRTEAKSDSQGYFYISRRGKNELVSVAVDVSSLPPGYSPTQGLKKAYWEEMVFTEVNLGIQPLGSLSGKIDALDEKGKPKEISGVRVVLFLEDQKTEVKDSITASEGSYYIDQIKPGTYSLSLDKNTFLGIYEEKTPLQKIAITSGKTPCDIENFNISLGRKKIKKISRQIQNEEFLLERP